MEQIFKNYSFPSENYNKKVNVDSVKPSELGINSNPTIKQTRHNFRNLPKYLDSLMYKPENSNINVSNTRNSSELPYKTFRDEFPEDLYPVNGRDSFFLKSGFCPVSARDREECNSLDPNYLWIDNPISLPDSVSKFFTGDEKNPKTKMSGCFKPRYSYVNNESSSTVTNGILPSLMENISDINPANYFKIINGETIMGSKDDSPPRFKLLECIENFETQKNKISGFNITNMENTLGIETFDNDWASNFAETERFKGHLISNKTDLNEYMNPGVEEFDAITREQENRKNTGNYVGVEYSKTADPLMWMKTQGNSTEIPQPSRRLTKAAETNVQDEPDKPHDLESETNKPPSEALMFGLTNEQLLIISIFILALLFLCCQNI
jgi:hypothetical protein